MVKKYLDFNTIHIFDFDDTLVKTPKFEEVISKYINENLSAKNLLDKSLININKGIKDLKIDNGRIFIPDPNSEIKVLGNWVRKKTRVYITCPDLFIYTDDSTPKSVKELSEFYNSTENKCIVTARPDDLRDKLLEVMNNLGLEKPKYGIHMRPKYQKNAGQWKGKKIVEIVRKDNFKKAIFYEDNKKIIKSAKKVVNGEIPNLNFETIKVI